VIQSELCHAFNLPVLSVSTNISLTVTHPVLSSFSNLTCCHFLLELDRFSFEFFIFLNFSLFFIFFFFDFQIIGNAPYKCPVCRSVFALPATATSAASLPVNHFASSVLSPVAEKKKKVNPNDIQCDFCEDNEEDATSYCLQCSQYFCGGCQRGHKRLRTATGHEFVSVEKAQKGKMKASVMHCEKHPHLQINYYCHTDKQAICSECGLEHHKDHKTSKLVEMVQGFKEEISTLVNEVSSSFLFFSFFSFFISFLLFFFFFIADCSFLMLKLDQAT